MADHRLLLLRHAQAADYASGVKDHERPLTDFGIEQATAVGAALRGRGVRIEQVLCSSATRTRQTWNALGIDAPVEYSDSIYNAGADSILDSVQLLDEAVGTALVIGHGPGVPTLAVQLAGPGSDQHGLDVIITRYPVATVSEFDVDGPWADLRVARLNWLRLAA
ncbi:phosphohistidine phosphatase [Microlunatus endophyticus]|uniref:Phosphohistidine phosphatase n=1 Tax=Microlunatus endophyticus TaxID=1716077 RepID=A0A917W3S0_9ACTN|nr:histidine phosphatase family protein [Microlunatus endophyticus]GGL59333.1 phosphohistidine phosphatase [Microlunatus endophyticus]